MSKYIQLYSANRNRQLFPNPSAFNVPFVSTHQKRDPSESYDPIINGPIYYAFNYVPIVITGTFQPNTKNNSPVLDPQQTGGLVTIDNYYSGWVIVDVGTGSIRLVKTYNSSTGVISMNTLFPRPFTGSGTYILVQNYNPGFIYIPQSDINGNTALTYEQAYLNYYVVFETPNAAYSNADNSNIFYRKIIYYDNIYSIAYFDSPLPPSYNPAVGTQLYTLRKTLPLERWTIPSTTIGNVITLPPSASAVDNYYVGKYVYFSSNFVASPSPTTVFYPIYGFYYITAYNAATNQLTVNNDINGYNLPSTADIINITNFVTDNYCPYLYNGTMVSENQATCYEISLDNLTVPNIILTSGSRIAFYSFLYVQFTNLSSPTTFKDIINSNNPVAGNALFVVSVTNTNQPSTGTYLALKSEMKQTITIKPNDGFRFAIFLPDGTPFQTLQQDVIAPYPPNLFLQISATFSLKKVAGKS